MNTTVGIESVDIVTVDGARGSGKSRLASGLRDRFGCGVLEIGPLFRVCAWLVERSSRDTYTEAVELLNAALSSGDVQIDPHHSTQMSAMRIMRPDVVSDVDLWDPGLDVPLRAIASSREVVADLGQIVRRLTHDARFVVVGREAGSEFFPTAKLKIVLETDTATRTIRKANQTATLGYQQTDDFQVDAPEPVAVRAHTVDALRIGTTGRSPEEVLGVACNEVTGRLGWDFRQKSGGLK